MFRSKRLPAILLAVLLCAVLLSSLFFIILEADHDCSGEDCAVCAVLSLCQQLIHTLHQAAVIAALLAVLRTGAGRKRSAPAAAAARITPITLRVKLSD